MDNEDLLAFEAAAERLLAAEGISRRRLNHPGLNHDDCTIPRPPSAGPVNLGKAGDFAILAKAGISTTAGSAITGNIGERLAGVYPGSPRRFAP